MPHKTPAVSKGGSHGGGRLLLSWRVIVRILYAIGILGAATALIGVYAGGGWQAWWYGVAAVAFGVICGWAGREMR